MMRYFDASALAKRYVREAGSDDVSRWLREEVPVTSRLSEVEIASALVRRWREGGLSMADRDGMLARVRSDLSSMYIVEVSPEIGALAVTFLVRHPLRSGDAVQLASCIHLQRQVGAPVTLVAYDARLTQAAEREGVRLVTAR